MPLNYLELQPKLREFARHAAGALKAGEDQRKQLMEWLQECAAAPQTDVRQRCQAQMGERTALPAGEALDQTFAAGKAAACMLLAADGSQIVPSAHDAVPLALINVGMVVLDTAGHQAPAVVTSSTIENDSPEGIEFAHMSEDWISLKRDVAEMDILAKYDPPQNQPVVALRDGPLELFHQPQESEAFAQAFQQYIALLKQLSRKGFSLAGYIDRSQSTTITQMLHIFKTGQPLPKDQNALPDIRLMELLLPPGRRSAIFELQSPSSAHYSDNLRLHFFYLNVGRSEKPYVVRVELPAWVALDPQRVAQLQSLLLEQCALLGNRPYPYILHRAHETAVVHFDEKEQLQQALQIELRKNGADAPQTSYKQTAKELQTRTRM
jgi:hypothetical protein